jgi:hypothetical protein
MFLRNEISSLREQSGKVHLTVSFLILTGHQYTGWQQMFETRKCLSVTGSGQSKKTDETTALQLSSGLTVFKRPYSCQAALQLPSIVAITRHDCKISVVSLVSAFSVQRVWCVLLTLDFIKETPCILKHLKHGTYLNIKS